MLKFKPSDKKILCPNFKEELEKIGYKLSKFNDKWRSSAIYRQGNNETSLVIDEKGFYDFGENFGGTIYDLIRLTTGESLVSIHERYKSGVNPETLTERNDKFIEPDYFFIEEKHPVIYSEKILSPLSTNYDYFLSRKISVETQKLFEVKFAVKNIFGGRVIFPIRDENKKIVGVAGRKVYDNQFGPKWKIKGCKNSFLYRWDIAEPSIKNNNFIILVESIGDLLALHECGIKNVVCLFGLGISPKLTKKLISLDCDVVISTNNDTDKGQQGVRAANLRKKQLANYINSDKIHIVFPDLNDWNLELISNDKNSIRAKFLDIFNYVKEKNKNKYEISNWQE